MVMFWIFIYLFELVLLTIEFVYNIAKSLPLFLKKVKFLL